MQAGQVGQGGRPGVGHGPEAALQQGRDMRGQQACLGHAGQRAPRAGLQAGGAAVGLLGQAALREKKGGWKGVGRMGWG